MIDDLLCNEHIKDFVNDILCSEKYFQKKLNNMDKYTYEVSREILLFTFYDALIKYKLIIKDKDYLNDYLYDLDRLFKKIIDYQDINHGINKLICKLVANKLYIGDINTSDAREKIVTYIFKNYYIESYLYHGFSTVYEYDLKENGFIPEIYNNLYSKMNEINKIYIKYNDLAFSKDFNDHQVFFTDNFIDACYFSLYSPKYFYKFLLDECENNKCSKRVYLDNNFDLCINSVKKYIDKKFTEDEKKTIVDTLKEEWDLLNSVERKVSIMVVKRKIIDKIDSNLLDSLLSSDDGLYDLVDRLLGSKNKTIGFSDILKKDNYEIISLDYKDRSMEVKDKIKSLEKLEDAPDAEKVVDDMSGSVTVLMLLGSLCISLGVIVTVIMMLGGN